MSDKADKRIAQRALKDAKNFEKKAEQVAKIVALRRPEQTTAPAPKKIPIEYVSGSRHGFAAKLDRSIEDRVGTWQSWGRPRDWDPEPGEDYVAKILSQCCGKTWGDIESETVKKDGELRHVAYSVEQIHQEAQDRLKELQLDDFEEIFRFRTAGTERLYGLRVGVTFKMLWYDPYHNIYPLKTGSNFTAPAA